MQFIRNCSLQGMCVCLRMHPYLILHTCMSLLMYGTSLGIWWAVSFILHTLTTLHLKEDSTMLECLSSYFPYPLGIIYLYILYMTYVINSHPSCLILLFSSPTYHPISQHIHTTSAHTALPFFPRVSTRTYWKRSISQWTLLLSGLCDCVLEFTTSCTLGFWKSVQVMAILSFLIIEYILPTLVGRSVNKSK